MTAPYLRLAAWLFLLAFVSHQAFPQAYTLSVSGDVKEPLALSAGDIDAMPQVTATGVDHDGNAHEYSGVTLVAILARAGAPLGDSLKGTRLLDFVQAEAADGYKVIFALPEIDSSYNERTIIVADKKNGKPLDEKEGPLQIIVPGEKKHARWIRQLTKLRVLTSTQ